MTDCAYAPSTRSRQNDQSRPSVSAMSNDLRITRPNSMHRNSIQSVSAKATPAPAQASLATIRTNESPPRGKNAHAPHARAAIPIACRCSWKGPTMNDRMKYASRSATEKPQSSDNPFAS